MAVSRMFNGSIASVALVVSPIVVAWQCCLCLMAVLPKMSWSKIDDYAYLLRLLLSLLLVAPIVVASHV